MDMYLESKHHVRGENMTGIKRLYNKMTMTFNQ